MVQDVNLKAPKNEWLAVNMDSTVLVNTTWKMEGAKDQDCL